MWFKIILLLVLIMGSQLSVAQDRLYIRTKIAQVDSLICFNNLVEAEEIAKSIDSLLTKMGEEKGLIDLHIGVMLLQAQLYALNEEFTKSLKLSLNVIDLANNYHQPELEFGACLNAALVYEISDQPELSKKYLDKAQLLYETYYLERVYSTYCIRVSSFYRFNNQKDSATFFAYKALEYAKRYQNRRDISDAYLLLNVLLDDYDEAIKYGLMAAATFLEKNDLASAASMYSNVTRIYFNKKDFDKAFLYSDSTLSIAKSYRVSDLYQSFFFKNRADIFEALGNADSALLYYKKFHTYYANSIKEQETTELKIITERYQNDKNEALIKRKDEQMIFIIILLAVIAIASLLIVIKNRKISSQNRIIGKQVEDLVKILEQKQMLLSELQHRVKNNLQHVISILEIQKESVDFNNIDELIRSNQNRIHSMALLHKKLSVSDNVNEVDLNRYVLELTELVVDSYDNYKKEICIKLHCTVDKISIDKALPLGLIIVELVSNSIKHAFSKLPQGSIDIKISHESSKPQIKFSYADNGTGFDFDLISNKGLGLEIVKGLIDQLDGKVETTKNNGFELIVHFLN